MSNANDFIIKNGVLSKYVGPGGDVVIPEGVKTIGWCAFANYVGGTYMDDHRVTSVTFPKTLKVIGDYAFCRNIALKCVIFSSGLIEIGLGAFRECHALVEVEIPEGVGLIKAAAFSSCRGLRKISIPGSINHFCDRAFEGLDSLETFVIEPAMQYKEHYDVVATHLAFRVPALFTLESLAEYYINGKFQACEQVDKALFRRLNTKANRTRFFGEFLRAGNADMTAKFLALIPKMSAEELDSHIQNAEENPEIRTLFINYKESLYSAADLAAMEEARALKDLGLVERTVADWKKIYKINSNGEITGYKDSSPVAEIPAKVRNTCFEVGANAFKYCDFLESVTIAEGITLIGNSAFNGCAKLAQITIPSTLKRIGASAFKNCTALTAVYFPGGITNIGIKAFEGCDNLVIHAPVGSKILQYAEKNNIPFVAE